MSEKRFNLSNPISHNPIPSWVSIIHDDIEHKHLNAEEICDLLNALHQENDILNKNEDDLKECTIENIKLKEENEQLRKENERLGKMNIELFDKVIVNLRRENEQLREYIDTIFEGNTHICNELDIEDVQFYCERNKDYRSPSCLYQKCFNEENLVELSEKIKELFDDE